MLSSNPFPEISNNSKDHNKDINCSLKQTKWCLADKSCFIPHFYLRITHRNKKMQSAQPFGNTLSTSFLKLNTMEIDIYRLNWFI